MNTLKLSNIEVAYLLESLDVSIKASPGDKDQFQQLIRIINDAVIFQKPRLPKIIQIQAFQPTQQSWHALIGIDDKGQCYSRTLSTDGWSPWMLIEEAKS